MLLVLTVLCAITAQPLVDADVLEPSVQNEVDHALSVASTNCVAVAEAAVSFATLYATNGMSATDRAIALVSSQGKDGAWRHAGEDVTPVARRILLRTSGGCELPRLCVGTNVVDALARREGIALGEAAAKIEALGFFSVPGQSLPSCCK